MCKWYVTMSFLVPKVTNVKWCIRRKFQVFFLGISTICFGNYDDGDFICIFSKISSKYTKKLRSTIAPSITSLYWLHGQLIQRVY